MTAENVSTTAALDVSISPKSVSNSPSGVLVLEENNEHMPSEEEILLYATSIGIDTKKEPELIYLAREGISAPLPDGWTAIQDKDNNIFFHECSTGRTTQDHPMDALYRKLVTEARKKRMTNTSTIAGATVVADSKPPSTSKPSCSSTGGQKVPEGSQSVATEKQPPLASVEPVSDDLPTTYQALPFPHTRRSVQTSAVPSLFRTPLDKAPERHVRPLHNSTVLARDSPRVSLDKTALVTAERSLSALQAHVHCLKASNNGNTVLNPEFLTPADRWFWSVARSKSPRPNTNTPQRATKASADEMPHLETSPSSQLRQKPPRVLGEINNYVDQPTVAGGVSVSRLREEQVASDSDRENLRSCGERLQEEEDGEGEALDLQFGRVLRLSDRAPAVDAFSSGHFQRHRQSGVAGLYSLYSPPGSSGKEGVNSGVAHESPCVSCAATHSNYRPQSGDMPAEPAALPTCFLPSPTTSPTAFDANLGLRCMMDERARLQRKMTCLKLTYKAYKMKLAEMDSGLRMLYSAASSASSPYMTVSGAPPSGSSPRPSGRDHSLSVRRRPPNEDYSNLTSSESSVGGGGGTASPSAHRRSVSRYPAAAAAAIAHQSDLFINTLTGRPLIMNRLYRPSELTRLQTPEPLPRFRRSSSSHSASRGF
uniref:Centrosomal protein of n=2 Tax=Schistocephalus solidus TaxID=70667 RepID=A0A0X3NLB7_SCHSO